MKMYVKIAILLSLAIPLAGCSKKPAVSIAAESARQELKELQAAMPIDCLTTDVRNGILDIQQSINTVETACLAETERLRGKIDIYQGLLVVLGLALAAVLWCRK